MVNNKLRSASKWHMMVRRDIFWQVRFLGRLQVPIFIRVFLEPVTAQRHNPRLRLRLDRRVHVVEQLADQFERIDLSVCRAQTEHLFFGS